MGVDQEIQNVFWTIEGINYTLVTFDTKIGPLLTQLDTVLQDLDTTLENAAGAIRDVSVRIVDTAHSIPRQWLFLLILFAIIIALGAIALYMAWWSYKFIRDGRHKFPTKQHVVVSESMRTTRGGSFAPTIGASSDLTQPPPSYEHVLSGRYRGYTQVPIDPS